MNIFGKSSALKSIITFLTILSISCSASAEQYYVIADSLNGRSKPSKKAAVEAYFVCGDTVEPIQLNENGWVEVYGGETGTVWCKAEYVSICSEPINYTADSTVNVRANPSYDAKVVDKIKKGRTKKITAEVLGWGYIKGQGWVDLSYFVKADN